MRLISALLLVASVATPALAQDAPAAVIADTRAAIAAGDFAKAEGVVAADRKASGVTPANLEAQSWLGRGALAAKRFDQAEKYAEATYALATAELKKRPMDQEPRLPIAIGAAIEVLGQVGAARGERTEAVRFLKAELEKYKATSLYKRIQKNINLISLDGQPAMPVDASEYLGSRPPSLDSQKGKVVLLFFWAHWCPDCKNQGPALASLLAKYKERGLAVVAPTQRYGYVAGGRQAGRDEERQYIAQIKKTHYGFLDDQAITLAEANHQRYGVSTTPTLVVLDRSGSVRSYHPGQMNEAELDALVQPLLAAPTAKTQ